jgi:hypothetical protein
VLRVICNLASREILTASIDGMMIQWLRPIITFPGCLGRRKCATQKAARAEKAGTKSIKMILD